WVHHQPHARRIHDPIVGSDVRVVLRDLPKAVEEEAVGELHDVGLVDGRHAPAPVGCRIVEREPRDPGRGGFGDDLQGLDDSGYDDVLESAVEVFGVLPDDNNVYIVKAALHAGQVLYGPEVGIQVEGLAQPHVD